MRVSFLSFGFTVDLFRDSRKWSFSRKDASCPFGYPGFGRGGQEASRHSARQHSTTVSAVVKRGLSQVNFSWIMLDTGFVTG